MKLKIKITCPVCGHDNEDTVEICSSPQTIREIITCDAENGGCDKPFIYSASIDVHSNIKTQEITI